MYSKIILGLFLFSIIACDFPEHYFTPQPECVHKIEFSDTPNSESETYQRLILEHIKAKNPEHFRYFFKTFIDENDATYMMTNFRNNDACFDIKILVEKWDKLAGMKRVNGRAYPRELYDLKWELASIDGKAQVVYMDMHKIID